MCHHKWTRCNRIDSSSAEIDCILCKVLVMKLFLYTMHAFAEKMACALPMEIDSSLTRERGCVRDRVSPVDRPRKSAKRKMENVQAKPRISQWSQIDDYPSTEAVSSG